MRTPTAVERRLIIGTTIQVIACGYNYSQVWKIGTVTKKDHELIWISGGVDAIDYRSGSFQPINDQTFCFYQYGDKEKLIIYAILPDG